MPNENMTLHQAVKEGRVDVKDNYGQAPLQGAAENNRKSVTKPPLKIVGFLLKKDVKNPSQMVAENSRKSVTKAPLINTKSNYGYTPLQGAAENSCKSVTKAPLINTKGNYGHTPLQGAAENSCKGVTRAPLINTKGNYGQTPLQQSVDKVRREIVGFLEGMDGTANVGEIRNKVAEFLATKGAKVDWPVTQVNDTQTAQAGTSQSK